MIKHKKFQHPMVKSLARLGVSLLLVSALGLMVYQGTQAGSSRMYASHPPNDPQPSDHHPNSPQSSDPQQVQHQQQTNPSQTLTVFKLPKPDFNQPMPSKLTARKFNFGQIDAQNNDVPLPNISHFYQECQLSPPIVTKKINYNQPRTIRNSGDVFYFSKAHIGKAYVISYYQIDTSHQYMPHSLLLIQNLATGTQMALNLKNFTNSEEIINQIQRGSFTQWQLDDSGTLFDIDFAVIEDDILYLSYGHGTYSADTHGKTGYLSAIDLSNYSDLLHDSNRVSNSNNQTPTMLWTSPALVSNAHNFVIDGDRLITGYGFTREKDYLYVLDKQTGIPIARRLVKTAPDFIAIDGDTLYVRTYDIDYTFQRKK